MARFAIIETGLWDVPRNEIIQAETPKIYAANLRHTISGYAVLIQDQKLGNVLVDTGINADWESEWPEQFKRDYSFRSLRRIDESLAEMGLSVHDIDLLICTHLHYDHAGNIKLFRNTKAGAHIMISEGEAHEAFVKTAMRPDGVSGAYFRKEFIMDGIGYQTICENTWLSDDVFLFLQRGHTPGVVGALIKTEESGAFIFPSDAVYSKLNYGPPVVLPGLCVDEESYRKNIEYLRTLQREYHARLVYSHDRGDFEQWQYAPHFYQ